MKSPFIFNLFFASLISCSPSYAQTDAIASCYDTKLAAPQKNSGKDFFVIIDQTTVLDNSLKQSVADQLRPLIVAVNSFSVLIFSAFTQGKYTKVITSGHLEPVLLKTQRDDISKTRLAKLDQCLQRQPALATQAIGTALRAAFLGSSTDIAKSDVLASLKDISTKVKNSASSDKVVLLVSDMLENSTVSSFYDNQSVRRIDPQRELKLAQDNHLVGDFGGARLYVMGAGLLNSEAKKNKMTYRDPKTMQALSGFWRNYFEKSNAELIEFGQPALLNPMH